MAHRRLPPGAPGRAPRRGRLRAGACRWLLPKFSIRKVFQWLAQSARVPRSAGLPSYRRGRRAVIRLLRTPSFRGRDRSDASDAGQSRAVCVAPGASLTLRLKAPPSRKTRSLCLRAQGEPLDRRSTAAPSLAGSGEPARTAGRLPVQLALAAHKCPRKSAAAATK